jgi:hypothetical protein
MLQYPNLSTLLLKLSPEPDPTVYDEEIIPLLLNTWLDSYTKTTVGSSIITTTVDRYSYLFDVTLGRLISAWGISEGRNRARAPSHV